MRELAALLLAALLGAGCAALERQPAPLTQADVVRLAREGRGAQEIIDELKRTRTVILLTGSEIARLHEAGVPSAVLDHLQQAQIEELRWRSRFWHMYDDPPFGAWGRCGWPPGAWPHPSLRGIWRGC
jgi:hypothetical protein